jgi:hypothetical protein
MRPRPAGSGRGVSSSSSFRDSARSPTCSSSFCPNGSAAPRASRRAGGWSGRRYRELTDQLQVADTIANRAALAEECLALGKFEEALGHYEHILALPMGDDAIYALGKARAQFGLGNPQQAVATLDDLRERWPDYQSAEGHLLYARALEESGRTENALSEYQAVANYYPGAEARVRYGLLLAKAGRHAEAKTVLAEVLAQLKRAPKYVRRAQAEWIALAESALRDQVRA